MNLGLPELLVILLFAFLIVGPDKLPQLGKTIGKALGQFRQAQDKVNDSLKKEGLDTESLQQAAQNPFLALTKVEEIANKAATFNGEGAQGGDAGSSGMSGEPAPPAATDGGSSARPDHPAEHKVISLSDKETFTQRKLRLQSEASSKTADDAPAASDSVAEGGEVEQA